MKKVFKRGFERRLSALCDSLNLYFYGCVFWEDDGEIRQYKPKHLDLNCLKKDASSFSFSSLDSVFDYVFGKSRDDLIKNVK